MAQGCPLSPLLFLFIGEPLTRMLENENDKRLKGVTIREHEHKVGQFADDTAAMLEGYQHLKKLFEIINKWERAITGMACNRSKTALIPMGSTRREEIPEELLRELDLSKPSEEPYEICCDKLSPASPRQMDSATAASQHTTQRMSRSFHPSTVR